ncbi:MAG: UDP-N-acetylmuramoyl-tripeptide--D-alanyl-D-alanine ligase [Deltaproteobacteria bacterium]|nr:UDP-N-acetylmuramoyl-tripeptide--D-alanyl-D-alanine ligase [Deltaproteobacteria bacterium]MBN2673862.1 UDP-N-acetylmuramoyl-tripeptide--D-alanyl-D-alanine ligase [Deltaproteobacteria bacterium]
MINYSANEISDIAGGCVIGDGSVSIHGVSSDSREPQDNKLFVALRGENFDGNEFAVSAAAKGATAVLVSTQVEGIPVPQIVVSDTLKALTALATHHREQFQGPVAAVTGSVGKTTTRSLLSAILKVAYRVHEPEKNFNNHIGVPLTVMKLHSGYDRAVFELGCSDFNEIGPLARIVKPDVALITNVGSAHLEKLKDLSGVARAKGELFAALRSNACAIINIDDPYIKELPVAANNKITFSVSGDADVMLLQRKANRLNQHLTLKIRGEIVEIPFSLPGEHNATDAVAAAAASLAMGADVSHIREGLMTVSSRPGRFHVIDMGGVSVIDDTYNANPSSMSASFEVLREMVSENHRLAVLGDMLELGESAENAHRLLGEKAASLHLKALWVYGAFSRTVSESAISSGMDSKKVFVGLNYEEIAKKIAEISESGDALLIKGSRGMKLETVVNAILKG